MYCSRVHLAWGNLCKEDEPVFRSHLRHHVSKMYRSAVILTR